MAYNYRRAEREWLTWKNKEEEQLRLLGVDEDTIQRLHTYDWEQFKKERNFYRWHTSAGETDLWRPTECEIPIRDGDTLLDSIENEKLLAILSKVDRNSLEMLAMRLEGYSCKQIAQKYGMQEMAVINRISRLRKKIKKIY